MGDLRHDETLVELCAQQRRVEEDVEGTEKVHFVSR